MDRTKSERMALIRDLLIRHEPDHAIVKRVARHYGISESLVHQDLMQIPEYEADVERATAWTSAQRQAVVRAEYAHRQACQALEDLQNGVYDHEGQHGTTRPSAAQYIAQIVATQRHLSEILRTSQAAQIWSEKRELESQKVGVLSQMMAEVGEMTDEQLRQEALRLANENEINPSETD